MIAVENVQLLRLTVQFAVRCVQCVTSNMQSANMIFALFVTNCSPLKVKVYSDGVYQRKKVKVLCLRILFNASKKLSLRK